MPSTTRGYPYPDINTAPEGPLQFQQLAEAIDADVTSNEADRTADTLAFATRNGRTAEREAAGFTTLTFNAGTNYSGNVINFPAGRFTITPGVQVSIQDADSGSQNIIVRAHSVTKDGCTIAGYTGDFPASVNAACTVKVHWHALQMLQSAASG